MMQVFKRMKIIFNVSRLTIQKSLERILLILEILECSLHKSGVLR